MADQRRASAEFATSPKETLHKVCVPSLIDQSDVEAWIAIKNRRLTSQGVVEKSGRKSRRALVLER